MDGLHRRFEMVISVAVGLAIGIVLCVLNVLVLFRSGASFGGSALVTVLGAASLRLGGVLSWRTLFVVFSIASSGYMATAALDTGVGAAIENGTGLPSWLVYVGAAVAANGVGIGLGLLVARSYVVREALPYPTLRPAATLMRVLTGSGARAAAGRTLPIAAAVGAVVAAGAALGGVDSTPAVPGTHLGFALSPLLFGLGFLIGRKSWMWLAAGALYSLVVWSVQDASNGAPTTYDEHLPTPWIIACGVGVMLGYSVGVLVKGRGPLYRAVRRAIEGVPSRFRAALSAAAVAVVCLAIWHATSAVVGVTALVVALLGTLTLFFNRIGGEVGILPLAAGLYVSLGVLALVGLPTQVALLVAASVCCAALASVYFAYSVKIAQDAPDDAGPVTMKRVVWTQSVGGAAGAVVGIGAVLLLARGGALGGEQFPAPVVTALSFVNETIRGSGTYVGAAGIALAIAGPIGVGLAFTSAVATMLGLGVLLPPGYALTIAAGGLAQYLYLRWRPDDRDRTEVAASGLILGEGLVMVVVLAVRAFAT